MSDTSPGLPAAGSIVVRQSHLQRDGLMGLLVVVFLAAQVRGYTGAQASGGRIAVAVIFGAIAVMLLVGWVGLMLRPSRLEISPQAIVLVDSKGERKGLSRQSGDQVRVIQLGSGRYRRAGLTIPGSGTAIPLPLFSVAEVTRQCGAAGWTVVGRSR